MPLHRIAAFAAIGVITMSSAALADPDPNARALQGEITLVSGFSGDPREISVHAGGVNRGSTVGSQCNGYIANQPDYKITYRPQTGSLPFIISVQANSDTMLAIRGPDGRWYCDDDSGGGTNPAIRFNNPRTGLYSIFVGSYNSGQDIPALLRISELTSTVASAAQFNMGGVGAQAASGERPDPSGESYNGTTSVATGFGARSINVRAGGSISARTIADQCRGFIGQRPDYKVSYSPQGSGGKVGASLPLIFTVRSTADTMLAINGPDGRWYCDDDSGEGSNPLVRFNAPASGRYDVFVGTYNSGDTVQAELRVIERDGDK